MKVSFRHTEMLLLILATVFMAVTTISLELSQGNTLSSEILWIIGAFIGVFTLAHLALCFLAPESDQIMLPVAATLNGLGLVMVYRLDIALETTLAKNQLIWSMLGIIMFIVVLLIVRDHRSLTRYTYLLGALGIIFLASPLAFWWAEANEDAKIWIVLPGFTIQPGEFSKILLLVFFAQLLVTKRALFSVAGFHFLGLDFPRFRDLAPIIVIWFFAMLIMAGANDFGPALLLFMTVAGMLYLATGRTSWLVVGGTLIVIGAVTLYSLSPKIQGRVANFLDPVGNYDEGGFQLSQALFGMSWGGITGTGLGQGHPEVVPVAHSDFILAAMGEELGLIGLSAVLILFAIFVSRGFNTALRVTDSFGKLLCAGLALTIAFQVFIVTAGISAMAPMTGLTTPFMSQGGSSIIANYMLLALILRVSNQARATSASYLRKKGVGTRKKAASSETGLFEKVR